MFMGNNMTLYQEYWKNSYYLRWLCHILWIYSREIEMKRLIRKAGYYSIIYETKTSEKMEYET